MDVDCGMWMGLDLYAGETIQIYSTKRPKLFDQSVMISYWFYFGYTGTDKKLLLIFPIRCGFCEGGVIPGYFTLNGMLRL